MSSPSPNPQTWSNTAALMVLMDGDPADIAREVLTKVSRAMLAAGHDHQFVIEEMEHLAARYTELLVQARQQPEGRA